MSPRIPSRELKRSAGIIPFARRLKLVNGYSACPFHKGDGVKSFHVFATASGIFVGTCFSECVTSEGYTSWNALDFVMDFDKVSIGEAIRRVTAELNSGDDPQTFRKKNTVTTMTAESWKTWGRAVTAEDVVRLAASRPHSATPSAETLNVLGFKMTPADFVCCAYRLGDTFYTVKGRRLTTKDFLQENSISQRALFNIDAVTAGCDVYIVESELDAAVLHERGHIAVSVISAAQRMIEPEVTKKLLTAARIFLIGDNDAAGIQCMDAIAKLLPPEKTYRMQLVGAKDVGELYQQRRELTENKEKKS
jgi:DNA primase